MAEVPEKPTVSYVLELAQQRDDLLAACKFAMSFVSHAADFEDWCGCDDCLKEWGEIKSRFEAVIAEAEGAAKENPCT